MPLMPAPPMPTKCTRLTLCFIAICATRDAGVGDASRRVGACAALRAAIAIASRRSRVSRAQPVGEASGVSSRCRISTAAPASTRSRALCDLVIGDRARKRHQHAADADRGELGDGESRQRGR